mmetsp:Transcript_67208/g.160271  ORF Transcript_67208/g.160271 Transcript_67208/m.160271 type:complete len:292 (+) Transcript_67208:297-1172(+)
MLTKAGAIGHDGCQHFFARQLKDCQSSGAELAIVLILLDIGFSLQPLSGLSVLFLDVFRDISAKISERCQRLLLTCCLLPENRSGNISAFFAAIRHWSVPDTTGETREHSTRGLQCIESKRSQPLALLQSHAGFPELQDLTGFLLRSFFCLWKTTCIRIVCFTVGSFCLRLRSLRLRLRCLLASLYLGRGLPRTFHLVVGYGMADHRSVCTTQRQQRVLGFEQSLPQQERNLLCRELAVVTPGMCLHHLTQCCPRDHSEGQLIQAVGALSKHRHVNDVLTLQHPLAWTIFS